MISKNKHDLQNNPLGQAQYYLYFIDNETETHSKLPKLTELINRTEDLAPKPSPLIV